MLSVIKSLQVYTSELSSFEQHPNGVVFISRLYHGWVLRSHWQDRVTQKWERISQCKYHRYQLCLHVSGQWQRRRVCLFSREDQCVFLVQPTVPPFQYKAQQRKSRRRIASYIHVHGTSLHWLSGWNITGVTLTHNHWFFLNKTLRACFHRIYIQCIRCGRTHVQHCGNDIGQWRSVLLTVTNACTLFRISQ